MTKAGTALRKGAGVRSKAAPVIRQIVLRSLQALMPPLVERWAARQFFRPRRTGSEVAPPRGDAFTARSGTYRLRAWSWGAGPTVLLVHGWEGHAGQLSGFVEPLVSQGFRAVAIDLPAHGSSSGRSATVLDFADAICTVGEMVGPVHAVVAHSFGGTAAALALRPGPSTAGPGGKRLAAERAVFLAPPEGPAHYVQGIAAQLGLSPERSEGIARRVRDIVGVDFADLTVPRFAHEMTVPLLLMHDPADRLVPWAHAQAVAGAWPGARLRPAPRLGHRRILTDPQVIAEAVSFIAGAS